jgi:GNAT superfamily N-acetyltransferase
MNKCTYIDGIASSQAIDTAGEIVDLKGLDISSLINASFNFEHESKLPSQIVGKILTARKIFSKEDCQNDRQSYFWNKCKVPFLYVMGRLFDDKKDSSRELAALFKDDAEHPNELPMVGFSIEGNKIPGAKEGMTITRSIARKCTVTVAPANKTCVAELMPSPKEHKENSIESLFKGEMELFKFESTYEEILEKKENLEKGAKRNWEKEGYHFEHKIHDDSESGPGHKVISVTAHKKDRPSDVLGPVGHSTFKVPADSEHIHAGGVNVDPLHTRKGIASEMYRIAEKVSGKKLVPSDTRTGAGKKLWEGSKDNFGKSENIKKGTAMAIGAGYEPSTGGGQGGGAGGGAFIGSQLAMSEEIAKGENGDWKKEGYTLRYAKGNFNTGGQHLVQAFDNKGNHIGETELSEHHSKASGGRLHPVQTFVDHRHRRKGIASAMYNHAEEKTGLKIHPSHKQTIEGKKFSDNRKSEDLKKALTAGSAMAAPSQLLGGAALGKESLEKRPKMNAMIKKEELKKDVGSGGGAFIGSQMAMSEKKDLEKGEDDPERHTKEYSRHTVPDLRPGELYHMTSHSPITGQAHYKGTVSSIKGLRTAANKRDLSHGSTMHHRVRILPPKTINKSEDLKKALTAGSMNAAPGQLVGGAALGKEELKKDTAPPVPTPSPSPAPVTAAGIQSGFNGALGLGSLKKKEKSHWYERADQAYNTWDKKNQFKDYMKKRMPHLAEGEIDSIGRVLALKKTVQAEGKLSKMYASYFNKSELSKGHPTTERAHEEKLFPQRNPSGHGGIAGKGAMGHGLGVHAEYDTRGQSMAGMRDDEHSKLSAPAKHDISMADRKDMHRQKLGELKAMPSPNLPKSEEMTKSYEPDPATAKKSGYHPTKPGTEYIHGLPKGHPSLGEHKGHTFRKLSPPTKDANHYTWAVKTPKGDNYKVNLPAHTGGSRESIHAHIDSKK